MELFDFSVIGSGDLILLEPPDMDFFAHLSLIEDPRSHVNRQHNLVDIMFLVMAAVVSGCEGWQEIEDFGTNKLDWLPRNKCPPVGAQRVKLAPFADRVDCGGYVVTGRHHLV